MLFAYLLNPAMATDPTMKSDDRRQAIRELKAYLVKFFADVNDQRKCHRELEAFTSSFATMGTEEKADYQAMNPKQFWAVFGNTTYPLLAQVALRVFQVPTSSAASERVWKVFSFIHSKRRNRLKPSKVEKLAYIYINAALLDELDDLDYLMEEHEGTLFDSDDSDDSEGEN
jgi:hypothetical protein